MSQFHGFAIDGFLLTGTDGFGCRWTVEKPEGWYTGGSIRSNVDAKMQQDGDWRGKGYRSGRVITLRGKVFAPDTVNLERAGRRLSAVLSSGGFGEFVGESAAGALSSQVQLDETPLFDTQSSTWATWQITVGSEDPLLYGPLEFATANLSSSSGGAGLTYPLAYPLDYGLAPGAMPGAVEVSNAGTSSYFPRLRIDGPVTNPVVTAATGDQLIYTGSVAAGQWLDIDCARRRVLLNGRVSMRHRMSFSGGWLAVPVGGGAISWNADTADPACSLSVWSYEGAWS